MLSIAADVDGNEDISIDIDTNISANDFRSNIFQQHNDFEDYTLPYNNLLTQQKSDRCLLYIRKVRDDRGKRSLHIGRFSSIEAARKVESPI